MGRFLRQCCAGTYHIVNRGVGLREVYLCEEDKLFFIQLICEYTTEYEYNLHAYSLINNGYNMLIETKRDNLSKIMRLINARYTVYFNRKYGRRGYLWEGRFKSWYITEEESILNIIAYIEHLPVYTGATKTKENSYFSSYRQFIGLDSRLECLKNSFIFKKFNHTNKIRIFLNKPISIEYINALHEKLKIKSKFAEPKQIIKLPELKKIDFEVLTKQERNNKIYELYKKGYSQANIGIVCGLTQQAIHRIIKKFIRK